MNIFRYFAIIWMLSILVFTSCDKDDPIVPNEEELITTLRYTLVPEGGGASVTLSFQDLDGDGGEAPIISSGILQQRTTYSGTLELFNEQESPREVITDEIAEEAESHQFFFQTTVSGLSIAYADQDGNGDPIGLKTTVQTPEQVQSGTVTVILRHEPDKGGVNVASGQIDNAGGETDIEVTFNVTVQ